jgi:putative GTP pyrophosphokinase
VGEISRTQIDRLGDRLKQGREDEADLRLLDEYRRSFGEAYDAVVNTIRRQFTLEPSGRRAKSTGAIVDKLRRESIRLSQIQDIAGCRLVVSDIAEQDRVVALLRPLFDDLDVVDRRERPSYGYRAVHVIVRVNDKNVEVQVRSMWQHRWAEISEKLADVSDRALKYGGGEPGLRRLLSDLSRMVEDVERRHDISHRL